MPLLYIPWRRPASMTLRHVWISNGAPQMTSLCGRQRPAWEVSDGDRSAGRGCCKHCLESVRAKLKSAKKLKGGGVVSAKKDQRQMEALLRGGRER